MNDAPSSVKELGFFSCFPNRTAKPGSEHVVDSMIPAPDLRPTQMICPCQTRGRSYGCVGVNTEYDIFEVTFMLA